MVQAEKISVGNQGGAYLDVGVLALEVDPVVAGVLLCDGDDAGVWPCSALHPGRAWKRRRSITITESAFVSGLLKYALSIYVPFQRSSTGIVASSSASSGSVHPAAIK